MDLAFTEAQEAVRDAARRFLAEHCTRERRMAWDATPAGHDAAFWRAVSELGWLGFALPAEAGGNEASLMDLGALLEECGRAAAPMSVLAAIFGGLALDALGCDAQRSRWLPRVAQGTAQVALAVAERDAEHEPTALRTTVTRTASGLRLDGEKRWVLQGVTADVLLVAARDGDGVSFVLVRTDLPGVTVTPSTTLGKDRQSTVTFDGVALPADALGADAGRAWPRWQRLRGTLAALLAVSCVGGAEAALDATVRYVGEREQFGARIGTFQAVQQMVAGMAIQLEGARHVARNAVWRLGEGLPADREIAIAKAWSTRAYREICLMAHQLHGGAGYVVEHELHRHTLRAKEAELLFGGPEAWLEALGEGLAL